MRLACKKHTYSNSLDGDEGANGVEQHAEKANHLRVAATSSSGATGSGTERRTDRSKRRHAGSRLVGCGTHALIELLGCGLHLGLSTKGVVVGVVVGAEEVEGVEEGSLLANQPSSSRDESRRTLSRMLDACVEQRFLMNLQERSLSAHHDCSCCSMCS